MSWADIDYIIRFGTMALKAVVAAMFLPLLPTRNKGKYYMLLEYTSQFYRTLVPTPLWVRYLSNPLLTGAVFAVLLTAVYLMIKGGILFTSVQSLYRAVIMFMQDQVMIMVCLFLGFSCPDLSLKIGGGYGVTAACPLTSGPCEGKLAIFTSHSCSPCPAKRMAGLVSLYVFLLTGVWV